MKKNKIAFIFLLCILPFATVFGHPIKMSTAVLEYNAGDTIAHLTINFFLDDFEASIREAYPQPPFDFQNPSEDMTLSISEYILENLSVTIDGKSSTLIEQSLNNETQNVCQVKFLVKGWKSDFSELKISNTLLFSFFSKQSNIIHLKVDGKNVNIFKFYPNHPVEVYQP